MVGRLHPMAIASAIGSKQITSSDWSRFLRAYQTRCKTTAPTNQFHLDIHQTKPFQIHNSKDSPADPSATMRALIAVFMSVRRDQQIDATLVSRTHAITPLATIRCCSFPFRILNTHEHTAQSRADAQVRVLSLSMYIPCLLI